MTFFNILCFIVAAALIYVGEFKNLSFLIILCCNTVIGIVQEIKSKKTIDKLSIVTAPTATVIREAITKEIQVKDLVLDDLVKNFEAEIYFDCYVFKQKEKPEYAFPFIFYNSTIDFLKRLNAYVCVWPQK